MLFRSVSQSRYKPWEIRLATVLVSAGVTSIAGTGTTLITDTRLTAECGMAAPQMGFFTVDATNGNLAAGGKRVTGLADPTANQDAATKVYVDGVSAEIGDIAYSAITKNASYWLPFSDTPVSRTTYAALFAKIGTTFGAGDGVNTFGIPRTGDVPVAYKAGDSDFGTVGATGGEKTHALTANENGAHTHTYDLGANTGGGTQVIPNNGTGTTNTSSSGLGTAHNNLQPFTVFKGFIRYA